MEVGLQDKKIGFIIQARMSSIRMPGKILMPLPFDGDICLLERIINLLQTSKNEHTIVVATSINTENDNIEALCKHKNIQCHRGSEENVLERFIQITKKLSFDLVLRFTADNPIIDIEKMDYMIDEHIKSNCDYTYSTGLPLGMNFELINGKSLITLENEKLSNDDKEHVTLFIKKSNKYSINKVSLVDEYKYASFRLSIDYPSDYAALSMIYTIHESTKIKPGLELIEYCYGNYPWIFEINANNVQKSI